jgi:hypothetical protein
VSPVADESERGDLPDALALKPSVPGTTSG